MNLTANHSDLITTGHTLEINTKHLPQSQSLDSVLEKHVNKVSFNEIAEECSTGDNVPTFKHTENEFKIISKKTKLENISYQNDNFRSGCSDAIKNDESCPTLSFIGPVKKSSSCTHLIPSSKKACENSCTAVIPGPVTAPNPGFETTSVAGSSITSLSSRVADFYERVAIFIRDVPSLERPGICELLLNCLQKRNIFPDSVYSLLGLLKYPQNVEQIKILALRERFKRNRSPVTKTELPSLLARGCHLIMNDLFRSAIRYLPNLIVIDYISESFVQIDQIISEAEGYDYKVLMLKPNDSLNKIMATVDLVTAIISKPLPPALGNKPGDIDYQRNGIHVPEKIDKPYQNNDQIENEAQTIFESFLEATLAELCLRDQSKDVDSHLSGKKQLKPNQVEIGENEGTGNDASSELPLTKTEKFNAKAAQAYIDKLKSIMGDLLKLQNIHELKEYFESHKNTQTKIDYCERLDKQVAFCVLRDFQSIKHPTMRRLYNAFIERGIDHDFPMHAIPFGELVISKEFCQLVENVALLVGILDTVTAYSTVVHGLFKLLIREQERVIILDSIHGKLVGLSEFLNTAKENRFQVYLCERKMPFEQESQIILPLIDILDHYDLKKK